MLVSLTVLAAILSVIIVPGLVIQSMDDSAGPQKG